MRETEKEWKREERGKKRKMERKREERRKCLIKIERDSKHYQFIIPVILEMQINGSIHALIYSINKYLLRVRRVLDIGITL